MNDPLGQSVADFYWYHSLELGNGQRTPGDYDISQIIHNYHLPADMNGLHVLDVGRGSGGFAFEFEKRGARVTATDIASFLDWDFVGGKAERKRRAAQIGDPEAFSVQQIHGAFEFAKQALSSKVESKFINVYDLSPDAFDGRTFDLVFAGSITSHLRDPILAFERLHSVTKQLCVVAAPAFSHADADNYPMLRLVTNDPDRRSWWVINRLGLIETLRCGGFSKIEIVSRFSLHNMRNGQAYEHLVAHAHP